MASRKKNKLVIPVLAGAAILFVVVVLQLAPGPFSKLDEFPASDYAARPLDHLGNSYLLRGQVDSQIAWKPELGRLVAIKTENDGPPVAVFLPAGVLEDNPRMGQRYKMRVRVEEGGLVAVEKLSKF